MRGEEAGAHLPVGGVHAKVDEGGFGCEGGVDGLDVRPDGGFAVVVVSLAVELVRMSIECAFIFSLKTLSLGLS